MSLNHGDKEGRLGRPSLSQIRGTLTYTNEEDRRD